MAEHLPIDKIPAQIAAAHYHLAAHFKAAHIKTPLLDARVLICAAAHIDAAQFIAYPDRCLPNSACAQLRDWGQKRMQGVPVSRLLDRREFYGLDFKISSDTFDPRPDSETVIDVALQLLPRPDSYILDLGTGSGCLLLSMLAMRPKMHGLGVDRSQGALRMARMNAHRLGLRARARFCRSYWFDNLVRSYNQFDMIMCNPPYIRTDDIERLALEVRNNDPHMALDGGDDGLAAYRRIVAEVGDYLKSNGRLIFEIGAGQAYDVGAQMQSSGLCDIKTTCDLAGIKRVVSGKLA